MTTIRAAVLLGIGAAALSSPDSLVAQGAGRVVFERTGYRLTALDAKVSVAARVVDARRRAVPNAPIAYRISDPSIAAVTPQGVVQSRKVGRTRVWAVSGKDSASAIIVVDQWASTFAFTPAPVSFDAIGLQVPLQVQLRDASGNAIPAPDRRAVQCRILDDRVATLSATHQLQSRANGATWVRCTDRGISDSVRIEVRQRPARAIIVNKLNHTTKVVPDTFRLIVRALDPKGDTIVNARPTFASLATNVLFVDPATGFTRAVGPGTGRIVTQIGDATDTALVSVTGTALAGVVADAGAGGGPSELKSPTLKVDELTGYVGDTLNVMITAMDALGSPIPDAKRFVKLRSSDTTVVETFTNKMTAVLKGSGTAYVLARFDEGGVSIQDSILVYPRVRTSAAAATAAATAASNAPFVRPPRDTLAANKRNADQNKAEWTKIRESGIGKTTSGRNLAFEVIGAQASHATRLSPTYAEARSGLLFGGMASVAPIRQIVASAAYRTGTLTPDSTVGPDLKLTEIDAQLAFWPAKWFGVGGGYLIRGESEDLSVARWTAASVTVMLRGAFIGDAVSTYGSFSLFPYAKFTGRPDTPEKTSLAGEVGLDVHISYLSAGFRYYAERFTFAALTGSTDLRSDRFSTLRFRIGLKLGR